MIDAVIFDLDGVLIDSEQVWEEVRGRYAREHGGRWDETSHPAMMGMSAPEWARYLVEELGVRLPPEQVAREVAEWLAAAYEARLPLLPGAVAAVRRLAPRFPLGVASSSNRSLIDLVLERAGIARLFSATVASEEVARGKPAPDVYLEAARRLGVPPERCAAVEDSSAGLRAAHAARLRVIAVPNRAFPPDPEALALADATLERLDGLTEEVVAG